jgi:hypothetical protein
MTYAELVAAINAYSENSFTTTDINTFIQQAEQRIYNTVQLPDLRRNQTGNTTSGNKYLTTPSDWLSTYSLAVIDANNEYTYLLNKDVNFIRESFPDTDSGFMESQNIMQYLMTTLSSWVLRPIRTILLSFIIFIILPLLLLLATLGWVITLTLLYSMEVCWKRLRF